MFASYTIPTNLGGFAEVGNCYMAAVETVLDLPALAGYRMIAVVHTAVAGMAVVEAIVGVALADRSYAPVLSPNTHTKYLSIIKEMITCGKSKRVMVRLRGG